MAVFRIPSTCKTDWDVYLEDQQRLLIKMFILHNRLQAKFEPYIFPFFQLVLNLRISNIYFAKLRAYICNIYDVVIIAINAYSSWLAGRRVAKHVWGVYMINPWLMYRLLSKQMLNNDWLYIKEVYLSLLLPKYDVTTQQSYWDYHLRYTNMRIVETCWCNSINSRHTGNPVNHSTVKSLRPSDAYIYICQ